ncbi:hypothetical protein BXY66_3818 [Shimia isoporae]|uniref:Uncharacterized protein n=2 Tax=Shimia isoporae TaxID=647720 RepID=A0A4R1N0C6_9RHOB|nr:hypothetical protein BXY66_3818 [Shimia isoporae]
MLYSLMVFLALAPVLRAGPWPRAPGEQFTSITVEAPTSATAVNQVYGALYFERGLPREWTLGLDSGADGLGYQKSYAFLRRPFFSGRSSRAAIELGVGYQSSARGHGFAIRPALTWGRGLEVVNKPGWLTLDGSAAHIPFLETTIFKIEATAGLSWTDAFKTFLQATYEQETGRPAFSSITPSAAVQVSDSFHLIGGVILSKEQKTKVKFGVWMSF